MLVQLLHFVGCPHVDSTRAVLREALSRCGIPDLTVEEWDVEGSSTPLQLRGWGSPTILINGKDLLSEERRMGPGCRIYPGGQPSGVPPRELVETGLKSAMAP